MTELNKYRLVDDVLSDIVKLIPTSQNSLIDELYNFKETLHNKAPEVRRGSECWIPFINILNFYIPNIEEDWQIAIKNIINISE